ncbi:MAG: glycerophosphodiester phosphodiesterase, partial [bacterium]|nr:glycerophosphodiester phosphodiesterase [bacterium]
ADGIELDVRKTADGVLVCHHNRSVRFGLRVSRMTFTELYRWYAQRDLTVTTLASALEKVAGRGLVNLELKITGIEREVVTLAERHLPEGSYIFTSFKHRAIASCRRLAPDVPAFLIARSLGSLAVMLARLREINATGIALRHRLIDARVIEFFRKQGLPVFAWTVNKLPSAQWLADLGVSGLITDLPWEMAEEFRRRTALIQKDAALGL